VGLTPEWFELTAKSVVQACGQQFEAAIPKLTASPLGLSQQGLLGRQTLRLRDNSQQGINRLLVPPQHEFQEQA
jgi:hypothetical protein